MSTGSDEHAQIRVFIVDDHPAVVESISLLVEREADLSICGTARRADEALSALRTLKPDVAIVDILLEEGNGLNVISEIHATHPEIHLLVFSMCDERFFAERMIRAGALGYVMKTEPTHMLVDAIRAVSRGDVYVHQRVASYILSKHIEKRGGERGVAVDNLTDQEILVFQMLGHSYSIPEIAESLGVNRKTVTTYQWRVKKKLGVRHAGSLVQEAYKWVQGRTLSTSRSRLS